MVSFNVRVPDDLGARFDAWAGARGGRSPALRQLIGEACHRPASRGSAPGRLAARPAKLTVRLTAADARGLGAAAAEMGLTPNAWVAALARRRLHEGPTFPADQALAVLAIQAELRRIGVNINQIARALNTAVMEGKALDLEVASLAAFRAEIREHLRALREAFDGNLAYWQADL
ncbi:plasmid mobilization relaxosome protein MobC [Phenylobacterium sp.]|uniref:plasmid mobilization relaxosome protein MobC n=1 Tax=Phenylobacterium sp. TaxID=1871053 RepID=UPI0012171C0E|nr:plasmid mobilization relaxosome protein MobC [Phenylobacterium sp.]THD57461.1 MAG: MobC family plasmid mobilization relaxosome protein [Phenylobacterium sp.]